MKSAEGPTNELVRYREALPVFIIGSVRSGTSAMMAALRDGAEIPGFNEGVLAQLLPGLLATVHQHYSSHHQKPVTMLGSVSEDYLITGIKNLFGTAFIKTMGEGRWLDKTPGGAAAVAACPDLLDIFPNARFVFCQRRGIENVLSRQNKFRGKAFENHCQGWAATMESWLDTAPRLGDSALAIDQRGMALEPEVVSGRLENLLELSAEQRDGIVRVLRNRRLEQTRAAQDDIPISLKDTGWSESEQETFRRICGPMMEAFGYSTSQDSSISKPTYQFFVPVTDGIALRENIAERSACRAVNATCFKIHPNPHGMPAAALRHRMIEIGRFHKFSAQLQASGRGRSDDNALIFRFSLERSADGASVFEAEQIVNAGAPAEWVCALPPLVGLHDAVLSVRPISDDATMQRVSGLWTDARLT
jgi:hypothetical protein